jgi:DNA mismatch repair ATPase MutS
VAISNALRNDILPRLENQGEQSTSTNRSQQFINSIFQRCNAQVLLDLQEQIAAIVDEEATNESKTSVVIREGFHEELDEWKEQYEYLEGKKPQTFSDERIHDHDSSKD